MPPGCWLVALASQRLVDHHLATAVIGVLVLAAMLLLMRAKTDAGSIVADIMLMSAIMPVTQAGGRGPARPVASAGRVGLR